jgi:hypothetical protein
MGVTIWPPEAEEKLRKLHAQGHSFGVIAARISAAVGRIFTRNACIGRGARMGLPKRKTGFDVVRKPKPHRADGMLAKRLRKKAVGDVGPVFELVKVSPQPPAPEHWLTFEQMGEGEHRHSCRYPMGEGDDKRFCPLEKRDAETSYCAHHHDLTHTQIQQWRQERRERLHLSEAA